MNAINKSDPDDVQGKGVAVVSLPVTGKWNVWKTWDIEIDDGGAETLIYPRAKIMEQEAPK
jgi:hypothetical protein